MSILSFIDNFSFATHWPYILLLIGIIIALVIVIMFVRKHVALTVVIVIFGGLLVGYYFGNLYFALGFTEEMTCAALRKDETEYEKYELDNIYIYQKRNLDNGVLIDNSDDIFAVKKFLFIYVKADPTKEYEATLKNTDSFKISIKQYGVKDDIIYQFVPQGISELGNTTIKKYLDTIEVKYADGSSSTLNSDQLYIFRANQTIVSFSAFGINYSLT